jgi:hypothetical protein
MALATKLARAVVGGAALAVLLMAATSPDKIPLVRDNRTLPPHELALFNIFKSACYEGSVRLRAADATPLTRKQVPSALLSWYSDVVEASFYKLSVSSDSYLVTFQGKGTGSYYKSGCALATADISYTDMATDITGVLMSGVIGRPPRGKLKVLLEWSRPQEGFTITVQMSRRYTLAQVSMLNEEDARKRIAAKEK